MKSDKEILADLKNVTAGLLVMSESDYPFELVQWNGRIPITDEYLREVSERPDDTSIRQTDLDGFLGENEQFRRVLAALKRNLTDVKVYKVGVINIPVFIVGRSPEGSWLGLSTRLIQT